MSAPFRIAELADLLHGRFGSRRAMALMRAYFDESGTDGRANVVGVAGFVGPADEWVALESEWESELARFSRDAAIPLEWFHAYDCDSGNDFWFGIDRGIREAYYKQLARVISKYEGIKGVASAVEVPEWNSLASPEFRARFNNPYGLCAEHCFQQMSSIEKMNSDGGGVALVFAEHPSYSKEIRPIFDSYMQSKAWSNVKSLTFSSPKDCYALQCADMISYESFRYWAKIEREGLSAIKDRPAWRILADSGYFQNSVCYGGTGMISAVRRYHAREGLPEPYPDLKPWRSS